MSARMIVVSPNAAKIADLLRHGKYTNKQLQTKVDLSQQGVTTIIRNLRLIGAIAGEGQEPNGSTGYAPTLWHWSAGDKIKLVVRVPKSKKVKPSKRSKAEVVKAKPLKKAARKATSETPRKAKAKKNKK